MIKMNKREKLERETRFHQRRKTPSFSASLLDAIYDSFDESDANDFHAGRRNHFRETPVTVKRRESSIACLHGEKKEVNILNRDVAAIRHFSELCKSASSSSDSSNGSAFSCSEAESSCRKKSKLKSIENGITDCRDRGFAQTKLRALKFYDDLKKVKQPISPGGRISNFLTSIFNSGNVKKSKMCYAGAVEDVTISSASFPSRSCLNKSSSSRGKSSSANQKTVRFYPAIFILDEASKPTHLKFPATEKERQFLKRYLQEEDEEEEEDYDDCESCSSSDLFEIDHLVGIGRQVEELPVYETTNFRANQSIANGFLL